MENNELKVDDVVELGSTYFCGLIYRVESRGIKVLPITKSIVSQLELRGTVSPKQADVLRKFKDRFDP